jgi:hypothetical protein
MYSVRPATIFSIILVLTAALVTSCTITQRRYRSGFHLEWKHRLKGQESNQTTHSDVVATTAEPTVADSNVAGEMMSIKPNEKIELVPVNIKRDIENNPQPKRELVALRFEKRSGVNDLSTISFALDPEKKVKKRSSFVEFIFSFFMSILIFAIPPILYTAVADYLTFSVFKIVVLWFVWIAGILGSIVLFQSLWPIIFACIIWNILYLVGVMLIIFITA